MLGLDFDELPYDPDESRGWRLIKVAIWVLVVVALTVAAVLVEIWRPG
jgi:hypothetical protein